MFDTVVKGTLAPLLLRLGLAVIFIFHGLQLANADTNWGTNWNASLPMPAQAAVAWGELVGGVALAVGFLTRLAALGIIVIMVGAIVTVHWEHGFDIQKGGYEHNFAIIIMCLALFVLGPGHLAVDRVFHLRTRRP